MKMGARLRKFSLLVHVLSSVGWLGAVCVFLALSVTALSFEDPVVVRSIYVLMEPTARYVLLPFAAASLLTGVVQSLGTHWGIVRHYWVIVKLVLTAVATLILLVYKQTFHAMALTAGDLNSDIESVRNASPLLHSTLAVIVLVTATALAIFKPHGLTRYGWRRIHGIPSQIDEDGS
jgi:hypothetical protein